MFKKEASVTGDFYEFSDDAFANDKHQPEETVDFVPTFLCQFLKFFKQLESESNLFVSEKQLV